MLVNPEHQFLSQKVNEGLMTGQFTVTGILIQTVGKNGYERWNLSLIYEIVQNSRSGN